jgi:SRSO17 transposase
LTAEGRKSVEPMAAVTAAQASVRHQKLLHFVGEGKWSAESVLAKERELVIDKAARDAARPSVVAKEERSEAAQHNAPLHRRRPAGPRLPLPLRAKRSKAGAVSFEVIDTVEANDAPVE